MKHKLDVATFSILPVQCGIEVNTPDGIGLYEGITSSGLVTVFINGGTKSYSWSEVEPDVKLQHIELIDDLKAKLLDHIFETKLLSRI